MPGDYDPDFDDTPPSSPKPGFRSPPPSVSRSLYLRLRRSRGLIIALLCISGLIYFYRNHRRPFFRPKHAPSLTYKNVDWRQFAYSQYATDSSHLCNAVMVFEALDRLGSKAQKILLYPEELDTIISHPRDRDSQLLVKARDWYGVHLMPIPVQAMVKAGKTSQAVESERNDVWDKTITKFLIFNQTQFTRIVHFDTGATVLKHMDDLFLIPSAAVAMPRAYSELPEKRSLNSRFMVIEPSEDEAKRLMDAVDKSGDSPGALDQILLNQLYADSAMVLPHRKYGLLTSEFRSKTHKHYHGNDYEIWNPDRAMREASLVHFYDHPLPMPWVMWPQELLKEIRPTCDYMSGTPQESGCWDREAWMELYNDFRKRRKDVCALLSVPAPLWPPLDSGNSTSKS